MIWTQLLGLALAVVGVAMTVFPDGFGPLVRPPAPEDLFATVERRIRGGMLFGFGLAFLARTQLRPWGDTIAYGVFYFALGALLARVFGLAVDGDEGRQWLYVVAEAVIMAVAGAWLWRSSGG
jgi:hypothetical protein